MNSFFKNINELSYTDIKHFTIYFTAQINGKTLIETSLSPLLQLFKSQKYDSLINAKNKSRIFFDKDLLQDLNKFLNLFTQTKIKDPLILNMLNMSHVSNQINLQRISAIIGHNTIGYKNISTDDFNYLDEWSALYSNMFQYYYQYHLKQRLYFLDQIEPGDLERTHPLFRHKVTQKNKDYVKGLFSFGHETKGEVQKLKDLNINNIDKNEKNDENVKFLQRATTHYLLRKAETEDKQNNKKKEADEIVDFLKQALDKFLPNFSELWHLNDSNPPPILAFKIIKLLLKYSVLKKKQIVKLMDLLIDKSGVLKSLEQLYYNEIGNENQNIDSSPRNRKSESSDSKKLKPEDIKTWANVLIKYRQLYAENIMLMMMYHIDDKMYAILKNNCDVNLNFEDFPKNSEEKFTKKDLIAIQFLEKNVNFEELEIFEEERGSNLISIFFGYIMSSPLNPPEKFTNKIKAMTKIFMNFFANVNDINLGALKLMNSDVQMLIKRSLKLNTDEIHSEANQAIMAFVHHCQDCYLTEIKNMQEIDFLSDFHQELEKIHKALMIFFDDKDKSKIQDMLMQNNFLWILLNLILKFSQELKGAQDLSEKVMDLFELCLDKNLYFQNMMVQGKVLRLLESKKDKLGQIGVDLVKIAFAKNPTLMVSNQNYLNLFFNYSKKCNKSQQVFSSEEDYYNSRAKFYELLSNYLDEKYYGTSHAIPEYDLICLDNILNTEYTEAEFLNASNIIEILSQKKNPEFGYKVNFLKHIMNVIAKSSSKRCTKQNNKKLRELFSLNDLRTMLQNVSDDYSLKTNIFRLFRNIYIFDKDNIFDDETKIYELVRSLINKRKKQEPKKEDNILINEENKFIKEENKEGTSEESPLKNERGRGGRGGGRGRGGGQKGAAGGGFLQMDFDVMIEIIKDEVLQFVNDAKLNVVMEDREKKVFSTFGVTMLMSTINFLAKSEIQRRLLTVRRANVIADMEKGKKPGENIENEGKDAQTLLFAILDQIKSEDVENSFRKVFQIEETKEKRKEIQLFEDIELESLSEVLKEEIYKFQNLSNLCEYYSSGKQKNSYIVYNLGASTDAVKRFSNKLEDRQASVILPFEILKTLFLANKGNQKTESFGMIFGAVYESFKLRKLATFSSMKKNYQDEAIDNIYLRILKESAEKNDNLAKNLCGFLFTELGGGVDLKKDSGDQRNKSETVQKKRVSILDCEGNLDRKNEDSAEFITGKKNNKYVLLEIFSNVLFHATETFQKYVFEMIQKPKESLSEEENPEKMNINMKMLDIIWKEFLLNFSFSYNRTRQDKLWKEYFTRTILLIKFHQYLCEENNAKFKKVFRVTTVKTIQTQINEKGENFIKESRFSQINSILAKFWFRNDWGKENFILIKRSFLFPVVQALFDFLTENMCGPYYENQEILTRLINFKQMSSFLDTFEPSVHQIVGKKSGSEVSYEIDKIKNVYSVDLYQMNGLKLSICDFLLTCCEGYSKTIIGNQLKKINFNKILDTIVKLIKTLTYKYSNKNNMTYPEYKEMKRVYKSSGFSEEQTMFLDMAIKLFIYLKILSNYSHTLKHLMENKEEIAAEVIKEKKNKLKIRKLDCLKRKTNENNDEDEEEFDESDFVDGLCLRFLGSFAKRLEINAGDDENDQVTKTEFLFFEPNPKFSFLSQETQDEFIETVDRSSHEAKLTGLITSCTYFEEEINITEKIKQTHPRFSKMFSSYKEYEVFLFLLCCLINLFIVIDSNFDENDREISEFSIMIKILGSVLCVLAAFCFFIWLWIRYPIEKKLNVLRYCERKGCKINAISIIMKIEIICKTVFNENIVRVFLLHIICCLLGLTLSRGFYAIEILSIVNLFGTFKYLAKSISLHWHQLLFTLFMVLIFIYIYSVFSNLYFGNQVSDDVCVSLIHCYFAILNTGFTNGMGIGGMLDPEKMSSGNYGRYFGYLFIDLMFFISVNCISLNLVFGIIVDTFGELRELNEKYGILIYFFRDY